MRVHAGSAVSPSPPPYAAQMRVPTIPGLLIAIVLIWRETVMSATSCVESRPRRKRTPGLGRELNSYTLPGHEGCLSAMITTWRRWCPPWSPRRSQCPGRNVAGSQPNFPLVPGATVAALPRPVASPARGDSGSRASGITAILPTVVQSAH